MRLIIRNIYVILIVLGALQSDAQTYDVEMVLPEQISAFSSINDIKEDQDGYLWLASYKGLTCYDGHKLIHYNNRYAKDSIFLSEEGTGYKYLLTEDDGLHLWTMEYETGNMLCFNTRTRKVVKYIEQKRKPFRKHFASENNTGIYVLQKQTKTEPWKLFSLTNEQKDTSVISIHDDSYNNDIYDYQIENGVHIFFTLATTYQKVDALDTLITLPPPSVYDYIPERIKIDRDYDVLKTIGNEVWINNKDLGLQLWNQEEQVLEDYTLKLNELAKTFAPHSLAGNFSSLIRIKDGSTYLLSQKALFRLTEKLPDEASFFEPIYSGKPITSMRQITEDDDGNIYASYYTGVAVKKKGNSEFIDFRDTRTIPHHKEATYSLTYHKDLLIWNTTVYNLATGEQSQIIYPEIGLHVNHYLEQDTLWVYSWYSNNWIKYVIPTNTATMVKDRLFEVPTPCSALQQDAEGFFWLAVGLNGLQIVNKAGDLVKTISIEELGLSYEYDYLYSLQMEEDLVLVGTQLGLGILDIKNNQYSLLRMPYANAAGKLQNRRIYFILPIDEDQYYLGTDYGLIYFDKRTLAFKALQKGHPLAEKEFNRNSAYKAKDGRYYVGTVNGLYSFMPEELVFQIDQTELVSPSIYHLQIYDGKTKKQHHITADWITRKEINLKPSDRNLLLEFGSSGNFTKWYTYRVLGLQEEWSSLSSEGIMEIYTLPHGDYTVELKSLKSPMDDTQSVTRLQIHKPQYWYLRWWAIGTYILALVTLSIGIVRYRYQKEIARQKELQQLRTNISSDLHDDVGSILGGLAIQSELMASIADQKHKRRLEEMSATSRNAMELMRDIVWAIDSRKDKFENLIDRMRVFAESTLGRKEIDYTFDVIKIKGAASIRPEVRQNIYLIFKEALTNIMKHSIGDHVQIIFKKNDVGFELVIHDNGHVDLDQLCTDGQGLTNMKMRAERMNGTIHFDRTDGFKVVLRF